MSDRGLSAWKDLSKSSEFAPVVQTLAMKSRANLSLADRALRAATKVGKFVLTAKRLTPFGAALWVAEQFAGDYVVSKGKAFWKELNEEPTRSSTNPRPNPRRQSARMTSEL